MYMYIMPSAPKAMLHSGITMSTIKPPKSRPQVNARIRHRKDLPWSVPGPSLYICTVQYCSQARRIPQTQLQIQMDQESSCSGLTACSTRGRGPFCSLVMGSRCNMSCIHPLVPIEWRYNARIMSPNRSATQMAGFALCMK
jgi:hypothetical protein